MLAGLMLQFRLEGMLAIGDVGLVAGGIDEGVCGSGFPARVFFGETEIAAVRAEKDVARQALEHFEFLAVVLGDLRIGTVGNQLVAGIDVGAANDDDMEGATVFRLIEGPGGRAFGVARGKVRGQARAAKAYLLAVVQNAVDLCRREVHGLVGRVLEVVFAARLDHGDIRIHDFILRAGRRLISALPAQ